MVRRIESHNLIVLNNNLVEANYRLSKEEQRIIYRLMMSIDKTDEDFKPYIFSVSEFMKILEIKNKSKYKQVQKHTYNLLGKRLQIYDMKLKTLTQVAWLCSAVYYEGQGTVSLKFAPEMKPFLLQLKKSFTQIDGQIAIQFKSGYSMRFNELLQQYKKIGERVITIEELRKKLGILENEYNRYNNFKQKVILQAQKEINNHKELDLYFDFEEIKTGRSVTAIRFIIRKKFVNTKKEDYKVSENDLESKKELKKIELFVQNFNKKYNTKLAINPIKLLIKKKGFSHIEETFENFDLFLQFEGKKKTITSIEGFFVYVCNDGYHFSTSMVGTQGYEANFDQTDPKDIDYEQYYYKVSENE